MKKNVRNALAISGLAIAIGASGLTLTASANGGRNMGVQRSHQERLIRSKKIKTEKVTHSRRFVSGFVQSMGDSSLTVLQGSKTFVVTVPTTARILDQNWNEIALNKIQAGDKVKISGTITDLAVKAKTIRDISLF